MLLFLRTVSDETKNLIAHFTFKKITILLGLFFSNRKRSPLDHQQKKSVHNRQFDVDLTIDSNIVCVRVLKKK